MKRSIAILGIVVLASCSPAAHSLPFMRGETAMQAFDSTGAGKIKHIVYIVQENRSFDNLFAGYPGADTVSSGKDSHGRTIVLRPTSLADQYEVDHSAAAMFAACHGDPWLPGTHCAMDGFDRETHFHGPRHPAYVYVPHKESKPYFDMGHEGVLADRMFQSQLDESFVAHQYVIAAQAAWSVDLPGLHWGCGGGPTDLVSTVTKIRDVDGPRIRACLNYQTLGDELDAAKLSWRFYAAKLGNKSRLGGSTWSGYQAIRHIYYGPDWKRDVISPNWRFITDVRAGRLANFTWITPVCDDSDHSFCGGGYGPSWVAALVNTVGESQFWNSTAIFIQWDDWGGMYDHVPPPYLDRDSLGFRVPLLILSPYARENRVTHVRYETASVLRFAEDLFGLDRLSHADRRANSPAGEFDFSQKPHPFVKIDAPLPPKFFMRQLPHDDLPPDEE